MNLSTLKRAIIYSRVSTDDQAERGTGLDGQERESLSYAESIGATVVAQFREDYTGTTLDRPDLKQVRAMLRTGQADILIAHRPDRLDRSEWGINLMLLLQELKSLDIELHYSQQRRHIDLNNPAEALMQSIFGWQAGEDRSAIVRRLAGARIERVLQGSVMVSSRPPYGYDVVQEMDGKRTFYRLAINEEEAEIVRKIFHWAINGDETGKPLGTPTIADKLTAMGVLTKSDKDPAYGNKKMGRGQWSDGTVGSILKNRVYIGEWRYGKRQKKNKANKPLLKVPAIINKELFDLARSKVQGRSNNAKEANYLLSGRVKCGCCGYKMHGGAAGKNTYYRCPPRGKKDFRSCENKVYNTKKVDGVLWAWLTGLFTDQTGEAIREGLVGFREFNQEQAGPIEEELEQAKATARKIEQQLEGLYRDYQSTGSDWLKKRIEGDMTILEQQSTGIQATIERLTEQLGEKTVTPEEEVSLLRFAATMRINWDVISQDTESKQAILNRFNIRVELKVIDGKRKAIVTGKLIPDEMVLVVEEMPQGMHFISTEGSCHIC